MLDISYKLDVRPHLDYGDVIYHNQRDDFLSMFNIRPLSLFPGVGKVPVVLSYVTNLAGNP